MDFPASLSNHRVIHRHNNRTLLVFTQPPPDRFKQLLRANTVALIQTVRTSPITKLMPTRVKQPRNSVRSQADQMRQLMLSDTSGIAPIKTTDSLSAQAFDIV